MATNGTVLVTGVTGYIGGHCALHLLRNGYAVRGTVRDPATADVDGLRAAAARLGGSFEVVQAVLTADRGWTEAVAGCQDVWHVASPAPARAPRHEEEVVGPAVQGTLRVLRAAAEAGVRRVVLTSSIDAVRSGHREPREFTEADWSVPDRLEPYPKSKTLAERAAWEFVTGRDLQLVTIAPGLVLGPLLRARGNVSTDVVRLLLTGGMPAVPRLAFSVVDVRDLAELHLLAMRAPAAAGQRYIAGGEHLWLADIARELAERFGPLGYRVPTRTMPSWALRLAARFDRTMRTAAGMVDVPATVSSAKAAAELGWATRPARESITDTAASLIAFGVVPDRAATPSGRPA